MSHESNTGEPPYDAEQDLQRRLSLATPEHTTRGFLFTSTLRTIQELGQDEALVRECLSTTGQPTFLDFFNYPTSILLKLLAAGAQALGPRYGSFEEALRQIGAKAGEHYMETPIGRSARLIAGGDPKQFASTLQSLYAVVLSYGEPTVTWQGTGHGLVSLQRSFIPPPFHEGAALVIARILGIERLQVRGHAVGALGIELELTWLL